jgi:hypothetical protein
MAHVLHGSATTEVIRNQQLREHMLNALLLDHRSWGRRPCSRYRKVALPVVVWLVGAGAASERSQTGGVLGP